MDAVRRRTGFDALFSCMSACLHRFQWRSQRVRSPSLHEPGRAGPEGHGLRWTALSAAGSAAAGSASGSAGSARGLARALAANGRGSWSPGSATSGAARTWPLYWRDRHLRFRLCDELELSPDVGDLLRGIDRDPITIFWG